MKLIIEKPISRIKLFENPIHYRLSDFGLKDTLGNGTKVSIIGTGRPNHINFKKITQADAIAKKTSSKDEYGATSVIAGILCSNSQKTIMGFTPGIELLSIKSFTKSGRGDFSSAITGILWSIAKGADIVIMPFYYENDNKPLRDSIKKAIDKNVIIITPFSKYYPSLYENVISVDVEISSVKEIKSIEKNKITLGLPKQEYITTFGIKSFTKINEKEASIAIATAIIISFYNKQKNINDILKSIS